MSLDRGVLKRHALGVDVGTSYTVAVARWPDGHARPILVDGSPLLPSAVYLEPDGHLIAGRDAVYSARLDPARFEPTPKRRVGVGPVSLGDRELPAVELIAAVLDRIAEQWRHTAGTASTDVTLTHPIAWDADRRQLLAGAAARAGLGRARLVAEPVAAATYLTEVLGRDVPVGSAVVVHDFGAGTLDVCVVCRRVEGFEVLAVDTRDDVGGLDLDAAIIEHLRSRHPDADWHRLTEPGTVGERRAQRQLWDDVRVAKERLSRSQAADLVVPLLDLEAHLTRAEFEVVAGPLLDESVQVTRRLLRSVKLRAGRLAAVFLVGGGSRIPLLATLLQRELGETPVTVEQPELAIAEGSILAVVAQPSAAETAVVPQLGPAETAVVRRPGAAETAVVRGASTADLVREPAESLSPPAPADASAWPFEAAGLNGIPSAADGPEPLMPPPVDPWPHAEPSTPDPDETVADDGSWRPADAPARSGSPTPEPTPQRTSPPRQLRTGRPPVAQRAAPARREDSPSRAVAARPVPSRPPARQRPKRRPGGFVRFLEIVLSIIVLVTVPLAAMVLAYSYGTGEPFRDAAIELARDLRDLFRTYVSRIG